MMQGACASRPGMAWSTILSRKLDYPLLNFGFSGNGTMDSVVLDELGKIDARMYIVDCLPNLRASPILVSARFRQGSLFAQISSDTDSFCRARRSRSGWRG
ncbi:MAG: SGNH/GDSL hydrolase family protein [Alistipes indistinctus]